jgi:hypothetical protein
MVKQLTFFGPSRVVQRSVVNKVSVKICFKKQIIPDKYVAFGFCERDFLVSPKHGAQRHKHIDLTNSLNQPCLAGLKICSKCPFKIGDILNKKVKHKGMNCPTYWNA